MLKRKHIKAAVEKSLKIIEDTGFIFFFYLYFYKIIIKCLI